MEAYKTVIDADTSIVLSTDAELLKFFRAKD
jgi:hypothetical protein